MNRNMKKGRRSDGKRGQQGIVRARFLAVAFLSGIACLGGVLYGTGMLRKKPAVVRFAQETVVRQVYDAWTASLGVVRIVCGDFRGSGVVIAHDADGIVIVSAKHLLMYDVRARVSFAGMGSKEPASVTGDVIGYSASYDLAYLYVPQSAFSAEPAAQSEGWFGGRTKNVSDPMWAVTSDGNGQQTAVRTDDAYYALRAGDFIVQIGMSEEALPECNTGTAQAKEVFISDYNAAMLLNECYAEAGMSGGGAFDKNGRLVGIIVAGDAQGTVCMPMPVVLSEYRELVE